VAPSRGGDRWEVKDVDGPLEVARLADLKPRTRYTVRVRACGVDGRMGNFSEPAVLEVDASVDEGCVSGLIYDSFTCSISKKVCFW